ncbi:ATP-binding protein [Streptomyces nodosus]|uniref:ATP-binding protein n=1 Tax=Streptomyces nodosus TaxID=40318 RepID=UPI00380D4380
MAAHQLTLSVPGTPAAANAARHKVMTAIRGWDVAFDAKALDTAELVVSELITNAVQHAANGPATVSVALDGSVLSVEVCDANRALPRPGLPGAGEESGRGLFLVAAMADRYGAEPTPTGKRSWAEITVIDAAADLALSATRPPLQRS